jgi:hypothetical protein
MGLFGEGWAESRYAVGNTVTLLTVALVIILIMKAATLYGLDLSKRLMLVMIKLKPPLVLVHLPD